MGGDISGESGGGEFHGANKRGEPRGGEPLLSRGGGPHPAQPGNSGLPWLPSRNFFPLRRIPARVCEESLGAGPQKPGGPGGAGPSGGDQEGGGPRAGAGSWGMTTEGIGRDKKAAQLIAGGGAACWGPISPGDGKNGTSRLGGDGDLPRVSEAGGGAPVSIYAGTVK